MTLTVSPARVIDNDCRVGAGSSQNHDGAPASPGRAADASRWARTRALLGPYCCELIPILIGPPASAVEVEVNQTRSAAAHRISVFVFITRAPPATRRTAQSCRADAARSATS